MTTASRPGHHIASAIFVVLAATWGSSYLFIEIALRGFDPPVVAFGRQLIAAICLAPFALKRGALTVRREDLTWLAVIAVLMVGGPALLVTAGQQAVSSSLAGILVAATPIFTAALAVRLDPGERSTRPQLAGVGLGMAGVVLLFGLDLSYSLSALAGGIAILTASLGYAVGGFVVKHKLTRVPSLGIVVTASAMSAALLLPLAITNLPTETPGLAPSVALVELGAIGTAAGWALYYLLIRLMGAQRASIVHYLAPACAVLLGVSLLAEELTAATIGGLALVVSGSWLATGRSKPAESAPRP